MFFLTLFLSCLVIGYLLCGKIVYTQPFKYPPTTYYFAYSMTASIFAYYFVTSFNVRIQNLKIIQFIGKSTLWIYLWHWFFLKLYISMGIRRKFFN